MKGGGNKEAALWTPRPTANSRTQETHNPPAPVPVEMPMSWEYTTIQRIVTDLRKNEESYTFVLANFGGRVVGVQKWGADVLSGAMKPSEVMSKSSEALLLLILENYWKAWGANEENNQMPESDSTSSPPSASGSVSSLSSTPGSGNSMTLYTKGRGSSREGWSYEGIQRFIELMSKVQEDRASEHGKEFETKFQTQMRAQGSRKRRRTTSAGEHLLSIANELSDVSDSDGE